MEENKAFYAVNSLLTDLMQFFYAFLISANEFHVSQPPHPIFFVI